MNRETEKEKSFPVTMLCAWEGWRSVIIPITNATPFVVRGEPWVGWDFVKHRAGGKVAVRSCAVPRDSAHRLYVPGGPALRLAVSLGWEPKPA